MQIFEMIILFILLCLAAQDFFQLGFSSAIKRLLKEEMIKEEYVDAFRKTK